VQEFKLLHIRHEEIEVSEFDRRRVKVQALKMIVQIRRNRESTCDVKCLRLHF